MSDLKIDIAAEFTGKKAFKEADTAATRLNKSVKTLATSLGVAYGTRAVVNFGKAAVKAFAEDQQQPFALLKQSITLAWLMPIHR